MLPKLPKAPMLPITLRLLQSKPIAKFTLFATFITFIIGMLAFSEPSFARSIALHEQPQDNSKVVANIDSNNGVTIIYTPKTGDWVKVADPNNGNVGWIKNSDLSEMRINIHIISSGEHGRGYQVIQYGNDRTESNQQWVDSMKKMKAQQIMLQRDIQNMMEDIWQNSRQSWQEMESMMPIIVVPVQRPTPTTAPPATATMHPTTSSTQKNLQPTGK